MPWGGPARGDPPLPFAGRKLVSTLGGVFAGVSGSTIINELAQRVQQSEGTPRGEECRGRDSPGIRDRVDERHPMSSPFARWGPLKKPRVRDGAENVPRFQPEELLF